MMKHGGSNPPIHSYRFTELMPLCPQNFLYFILALFCEQMVGRYESCGVHVVVWPDYGLCPTFFEFCCVALY